MTVDVLAIGPHPDDADLGVGGTLLNLAARGYTTAILDLTRGELGTRGTPEERAREAADAALLLKVSHRENAGLPDGQLADTSEQRAPIVDAICRLRPRILLIPHAPDRHPDHEAARMLCRNANFFAGVKRIAGDTTPWRAPAFYFYHPYQDDEAAPAFVMDISETFEQKLAALAAFKSQFYNPDYNASETTVSSPEFWENIRTRAAYWGSRVGARYGEPLYGGSPLRFDIPPGLE